MAKRVYAVKEIKRLMQRAASADAPTAMGGTVPLTSKPHALSGPEHTGQLPTTRLSTVETDTAKVAAPDGAGGVAFRAEAGGHAAVTLAASADVLLGLAGQALSLDTQAANTILAGPVTGAAAAPEFRTLVAADIPAGIGGGMGPLLLASDHAVPIIFGDILQASDGSDLLYASES